MAVTDRATRLVILDAGPIIHLDELGVLSLLDDFPSRLVPDAVWLEVEHHRQDLFERHPDLFERITPQRPQNATLDALGRLFTLHRGETEALQIALEHEADLLLTDDTAARSAAKHLGIAVHGTLGILVRAVRRKQRTPHEVIGLLKAIPRRSSLHIKSALLTEIISTVRDAEP